MDILKKNLEALLTVNPVLAAKILTITENSRFDVFVDQDPANINLIAKNDYTPLYLGKPIVETEAVYKDFSKYSRYPYLYCFGLGNGILYKILLNNPMHKRIVIFEPEIEIIYIVLNLVDFSLEISDGRLLIELPQDMNFEVMVNTIFNGTPKLYAKVYDMITPFAFYQRYSLELVQINYLAVEALKHLAYSMGNDIIDSLIGVEHHIQNLPRMIRTPTLIEAAINAKNTSLAVVVATGPSLAKQLPLLKEFQDRITILCVDASFPILAANGIKPDFVFSIERVALTASFYQKTPAEAFENVNFMITSVAHRELIESIKGGTLQLSMRPFGYLKSFKHEVWGYVGSGMSSANMAFEFAAMAGFESIVLIGQDLAYGQDGLSHSKGHIFGDNEVKEKESDTYTTAYGGKGEVKTTLVWSMFRNYYELSIAQLNDAGNTKTYNATEGGARIAGAIEIPFAEVLSLHADSEHVKQAVRLNNPSEELVAEAIVSGKKTVRDFFEYGNAVKKQTETVFLQITEETEKLEKLQAENRIAEIDFDHLLVLNEEIDKVKASFEDDRFDELFGTVLMPLMLHQEIELATIMVKHSENDMDKKVKLIDWIYAHRFWLFSLAGSIQNMLDAIARAVLTWEKTEEFSDIIKMCEQYHCERQNYSANQ